MSDDLTIDELARRAGTRTSTVRLYQTRGLLPPPEIRGRVGYYSPNHLARLRVIERLQQRGFSLASIKELLENWAQGTSLAAVLDPEQELATFGEPMEISQADFAALFPDGHVDAEVVRRAQSLGLLSFDPARSMVKVPSRALLEIGRQLAMYNIPAARSVAEFEQLARDARRIAQRFVALLREFVNHDDDSVAAAAHQLRPFAAAAIQELVLNAVDQLATGSAAAPADAEQPDPARSGDAG
jgi:DNA-binding transcriptional MerR regulator